MDDLFWESRNLTNQLVSNYIYSTKERGKKMKVQKQERSFCARVGLVLSVLCLTMLWTSPSHALFIDFDPSAQNVSLGDQVAIDLNVSGLGDGMADSLSTFDLNVSFDEVILGYDHTVFGTGLDILGFGSIQWDTDLGFGEVNLYELSLDFPSDLDFLQAPSFTLATLYFNTLSIGTSALELSSSIFGDAVGDRLSLEYTPGSITVGAASIPEPATFLLFVSGLVGLPFLKRRKNNKDSA